MSGKLSNEGYSNEDLYIAEKEAERRAELHAAREAQRKEQDAKAHWLNCPKCGTKMDELTLEGVMIEKCPGCEGVFFDKGEVKLLLDRRKSHSFIDAFKGFWGV